MPAKTWTLPLLLLSLTLTACGGSGSAASPDEVRALLDEWRGVYKEQLEGLPIGEVHQLPEAQKQPLLDAYFALQGEWHVVVALASTNPAGAPGHRGVPRPGRRLESEGRGRSQGVSIARCARPAPTNPVPEDYADTTT